MRRVACFLLVTSSLLVIAPPAHATSGSVVLGIWPQTYAQFQDIEAAAGMSIPYFRARQQDGQFDRDLVGPDEQAAAAAGYSLGMNIQPKTGTGGDRTGILYTDITAQIQAASGPYYDKLVSFAHEVLALPTYGRIPNYLQFHSEASTQSAPGVHSAQPFSGSADQYQQCYALVHQLFDSLGVTDKIYWQIVLDQGTYAGGKGGAAAWYPTDPSTYDLDGVDGYYHSPNWISPTTAFGPALAFAQAQGKQIWIDETGADEGGPTNSATAKAAWYASLESFIESNGPSIAGVVFSNAMDGGNWFFDSRLQGGRSTPNYTGTSWNGWMATITALAANLPSTNTLSVTTSGSGDGEVVSQPAGIDCGTTCSADVLDDAIVTFTATPAAGSAFTHWGGACAGTGSTCTITADTAKSVTAQFDIDQRQLTVTISGPGSVTSDTGGVNCPGTCAATYGSGATVTLSATAGTNASFVGWSGAGVSCPGTGTCQVTLGADTTVAATFAALTDPVTATILGSGAGTISSSPSGISCSSTCGGPFSQGSSLALTATPAAGSTFTGWGGDCSGLTNPCLVTVDAAKNIMATFDLSQRQLTVNIAGSGSVTSDAGGIDCGTTCSASYEAGTAVSLTATPTAGSQFVGWTGTGISCPGTGICQLTMAADSTVTATFAQDPQTLSLTVAGAGTGTVSSSPAGISCATDCSGAYPSGTPVTLSATADTNSVFTGWSGDCTGTTTCVVTMDATRSVTATFATIQYALVVTKTGGGSGTITGDSGGISCGTTCSANYDTGTVVALTASPAADSSFAGWSGACSGAGACIVTVDAAKAVTAQFDVVPRQLNLTVSGAGTGTVMSSPPGISCTTSCSGSFPSGTTVTLSATAGTNSVFTGWSGDCAGTTTCVVPMNATRSVTATFGLVQRQLGIAVGGPGSVTSGTGGINCPGTCAASYPHGSSVTLSAILGVNAVFSGWSGACSGVMMTCTVAMDAAKSVTATFATIQHALVVTKTGAGTVTSNTGGINCGTACSANYNAGTVVTLAAAPAAGSTFAGWSGACTGMTTCVVTLSADRAVTATFTVNAVTLRDADPAIAYSGWLGVADPAASGGFYRMSGVKNDDATWKSPATRSVAWVTRTGPDQGKASVTIDGKNLGTVDLYSATPASLTKVYGGLANKVHTVVITVLGTRNGASTGTNVRLDAFLVGTTTTQESDLNINYDDWKSSPQATATDGTYRSIASGAGTVTVRFTGTSITWITRTGKPNGKASVSIDGLAKGVVDQYRKTTTWQAAVAYSGLGAGSHTMVISALGQKNASASSTEVVVDGFIVRP